MTSIIKSTPLNYRIKVEKIDKNGNSEIIGDTGFIKPQTKQLFSFLINLMNSNLENENLKNELERELLKLQ